MRQGAEARRAKKDAQETVRREAEKEALIRANENQNGNQNGAIGFDTGGAYSVIGGQKVYNNLAQPSGGIGVDASGVYGVNGTPQSNKYTFNESDYIPSAENGYHLGNYKQTEMYGDPSDF